MHDIDSGMSETRLKAQNAVLTGQDNLISQTTKLQMSLHHENELRHTQDKHVCIPELIAMQSSLAPDTIAITSDRQSLTYKELDRLVQQLARHLQALGIGTGTLVGMFMERSSDMIVGMLSILKAGGAYVPLDVTYPKERLSYMLDDTQFPVILTQRHIAHRLPICSAKVIYIDEPVTFDQCSIDMPLPVISHDDLAYVVYTSGSTGHPKGVQVTHGNLLNLLFWHQHAFCVTAVDRATQVTSPAFDAMGWEIWPYLTIGASIHLPNEETRVSPLLLRNWLLKKNITITFLPTILAESIIELEWPNATSLRYLLTGADVLHHYPSPKLPFTLVNNYGPTESTVVATSGSVLPSDNQKTLPSIGRPILNTQVYILDEQMHQMPIGETGEMYIGGAGLAKGYLNKPELTDEKFVQHSFDNNPKARLYKTGDLARYLPDGQIEFIGRTDFQVKIRGYRIETNEIVSAINQHVSISNSVVIAREDTRGEKQLVAYIVFASDASVSVTELKKVLADQIPNYMIPATFVVLDLLPQTINGKVDRDMLPSPNETNTLRDEIIVLPTSPIEERLVEIVAQLLGLAQVSVDDNFFMLGGHSLLGTQVIMNVAQTFGVELTLHTLFNAPTVRELSAEIEALIIAKVEAMSEEEVQQLLM